MSAPPLLLSRIAAFSIALCLVQVGQLFAQEKHTPGIRARLYWIGEEIDAERQLAPNQSPNLDATIPSFEIEGNESWFKTKERRYASNYVLVLEADVQFEPDEEHVLRMRSEAVATLFIDGEERLFAEEGEWSEEEFEPEQELHRFKVIQFVNDEPGELELEWRLAAEDSEDIDLDELDEFEPIPPVFLKAPDFYFRPTNSAAKRMLQENDRAGKHEKVDGVFPGCDRMTIRPEGVEVPVGGLGVLPDGRLVLARFDARGLRAPAPQKEPNGELWLYSNVDSTERADIQREKIAEDLLEPCGVSVVGESIYVSQREQITRFDYSESERQWRPRTVASGWETNDFHALSFGLLHQNGEGDHPGFLIMARGTGLGLGRNPPNHGSVWRIELTKPAGKNVEPLTGGHRTPNGLGFGPDGAIFVTDNQGEYTPANELNHVVSESFYGFVHRTGNGGEPTPYQDKPTTWPAVILPQDEIANSPSQPLMIPEGWPYAGQMLVGDVKYGGLNRISLEKIGGRWQGAAYRFTQGLEGGTNRLVFDKKGNLFVGAIGGDHASTWNWVNPVGEKTYQGLQRLRPNGKPVFDLERVRVTKRGFEIRFTESVARDWLADVSNYRLTQWRYEATPNYGGPKLDEAELAVTEARPKSKTAVELVVRGRKRGHVIHVVADPKSQSGQPIWSAEAWYTLWNTP